MSWGKIYLYIYLYVAGVSRKAAFFQDKRTNTLLRLTHHRVVAKPPLKTGLFCVQNHVHDFLQRCIDEHTYAEMDRQTDGLELGIIRCETAIYWYRAQCLAEDLRVFQAAEGSNESSPFAIRSRDGVMAEGA